MNSAFLQLLLHIEYPEQRFERQIKKDKIEWNISENCSKVNSNSCNKRK